MKKILYFFVATLFFVACKQGHTHNEVIQLDNGKKWQVSEGMKPFIKNGADLLDAYVVSKDEDYKKLAEKIRNENNQLINNCTMKGKSHDELHKWLHPHLELVDALGKAKSTTEANKIIQQLQQSNSTYQQYFE